MYPLTKELILSAGSVVLSLSSFLLFLNNQFMTLSKSFLALGALCVMIALFSIFRKYYQIEQ